MVKRNVIFLLLGVAVTTAIATVAVVGTTAFLATGTDSTIPIGGDDFTDDSAPVETWEPIVQKIAVIIYDEKFEYSGPAIVTSEGTLFASFPPVQG